MLKMFDENYHQSRYPDVRNTIAGFQSGTDKQSLRKATFPKLVSAAKKLNAADLTVSTMAIRPATSTVAPPQPPLIVLTGISTLANREVTIA